MLTIDIFIAVLSFGLTCFGLGYTLGKNAKKPANKSQVLLSRF